MSCDIVSAIVESFIVLFCMVGSGESNYVVGYFSNVSESALGIDSKDIEKACGQVKLINLEVWK